MESELSKTKRLFHDGEAQCLIMQAKLACVRSACDKQREVAMANHQEAVEFAEYGEILEQKVAALEAERKAMLSQNVELLQRISVLESTAAASASAQSGKRRRSRSRSRERAGSPCSGGLF